MNTKKTIRKIIFITVWLVIGAGMVTLLAAAIRKQKSGRCSDYSIVIKGGSQNLFIDEKDVLGMLRDQTGGKIKGQPLAAFDLMGLERLLEKSIWVKDAELYFDNNDVLHITVTEREPVARVFPVAGKSFYIDSEEKQLPLADKRSANVPVFTGFPVKKVVAKRDKELLRSVREMAAFIQADPFWSAQVAQVDITPEREFEMVPVVGNHIVRLGNGDDLERKFHRLFIFYKNVLSQAGFDKYRTIDVQYAGQVIGVKGANSKVDSVQLRRNVEKLLQLARDMQNDSLLNRIPVIVAPVQEPPAETGLTMKKPATTLADPSPAIRQAENPNPVNSTLPPGKAGKEPKAVMPKRNE